MDERRGTAGAAPGLAGVWSAEVWDAATGETIWRGELAEPGEGGLRVEWDGRGVCRLTEAGR